MDTLVPLLQVAAVLLLIVFFFIRSAPSAPRAARAFPLTPVILVALTSYSLVTTGIIWFYLLHPIDETFPVEPASADRGFYLWSKAVGYGVALWIGWAGLQDAASMPARAFWGFLIVHACLGAAFWVVAPTPDSSAQLARLLARSATAITYAGFLIWYIARPFELFPDKAVNPE